jgi:hypothetical protein
MTTIKFEVKPTSSAASPVYLDGAQMLPGEACIADIEGGPHNGIWMFSKKALAEAFCKARGLTPEFVEAEG